MGIASLILGIISIVTALTVVLAPLGLILALIGLILGIVCKAKDKTGEKKGITIAGIIISSIMFAILLIESMLLLVGFIATYSGDYININQDIIQNDTNSKLLGTYSREVFSGNSFDYSTYYDNATFKFNKDSTFECAYEDGMTYKGTYEVYNGFYITEKASKISKDPSIQYGETLAENINNISTQMMTDTSSIVNTYLLYLNVTDVVEDGISKQQVVSQPFIIKYDPNTNTGNSVNVFAQTTGVFSLK